MYKGKGAGMSKKRIRNRFSLLLAEKAYREGKSRISQRDVAKATGLAKATVDRIANNSVSMYDTRVMLAICEYLGCQPGDLLVIEEVEESNGMTAQRLPIAS